MERCFKIIYGEMKINIELVRISVWFCKSRFGTSGFENLRRRDMGTNKVNVIFHYLKKMEFTLKFLTFKLKLLNFKEKCGSKHGRTILGASNLRRRNDLQYSSSSCRSAE